MSVDQPGRYTFDLCRWPGETDVPLQASLPATHVTDGVYGPGAALPVEKARIRVGDGDAFFSPDEDGTSFTFTTDLTAGPLELQTWLLDRAGEEICGAYYVSANRATND